jgi:Na+/melibiose symporter-like transporter
MIPLLETLVDRLLALEWSVAIGGVVTWVILAMLVAAVAGARGQSQWGFFVLSLLFSSVVGLLALFLAPNETRIELRKLRERVEHLDRVAVVRAAEPEIAAEPAPAPSPPPAINQSRLVNILMVIGLAAVVAAVALFSLARG